MRRSAFALSLLLAAAPLAVQAGDTGPADVTVTLSPHMIEQAEEYGMADVERLARELETEVETALAGRPVQPGVQLRLVLADAKPNRPTHQQLSDTPNLSMESRSIGGATIEGEIVSPDGASTPVRYSWYTPNLAHVMGAGVWTDAERTFERFARQLSEGRL